MDWEPDRGLQLRMVVGLVLVAVMPAAFVTTMGWAVSNVILPLAGVLFEVEDPTLTVSEGTSDPTPLFSVRFGPDLTVGLPAILLVTVAGFTLQYLVSDRLALRSVDAQRVTREDRPGLYDRVGRLARQADLPTPSVAVADTEAPNAFAVGRSQSDATVVLTEGLIDTLEPAQLDAVVAHELAHVKNRDAAVMSIAYLLPSLTYTVATVAYAGLGGLWSVIGRFRHADTDDARPLAALIVLFVVSALVTLTVSAVFWVGSFLLFRLLSQYRERAADRGAARITGEPLALASALATIDEETASVPDRDLRQIDGGVEALYVSPLDTPMFTDDDDALVSRDLFPESHPPTDERIETLQELAGRQETQ